MTTVDGHILFDARLAPDSLQRRLNWADSRSGAVDGSEERISLSTQAYLELSGRVAPASLEESKRWEDMLRACHEAGKCAWVDWSAPAVVQAVSGNSVAVDGSEDFQSVGWVYLDNIAGAGVTKQATSAGGGVVALVNAGATQPGDMLYPIRFGFLDDATPGMGSGSIRGFNVRLSGRAELHSGAGETDNNSLVGTYFLFYIDTSGSMDADVPVVTATADELKALLRDWIYDGDQAQADEFIRVQNWSSERWLERMSVEVLNEQSLRYVVCCFINEANSTYHSRPRNAENEPTTSFSADYDNYVVEQARRELSRGKVYSVEPTQSSWEDDNAAFDAHLAAAISGAGDYATLGAALATLGIEYEVDVPSGRSSSDYITDILGLAQ